MAVQVGKEYLVPYVTRVKLSKQDKKAGKSDKVIQYLEVTAIAPILFNDGQEVWETIDIDGNYSNYWPSQLLEK